MRLSLHASVRRRRRTLGLQLLGIAVHSASTFEADGTRNPETDKDLVITARIARSLKDWGTPPVIIGKMIGTPGEEAAILTDSDLQAWNVRILTARYAPPPPYTSP